MKTRLLHIAALLLSTISTYAQVSENFNKATLSTGNLNCWQADYEQQIYTSARVAAGTPQALSSDSRLSLSTSPTPIEGSASLRITESIDLAPWNSARSRETFHTPAVGADGNTVSFKLRINSATLASPEQSIKVIVTCGAFKEEIPVASITGTIFTINSTIAGSSGGGIIKIGIEYASYVVVPGNSTVSYSVDIDEFTTTASSDPNSTCLSPLPVTLASFTANKAENAIKLDWTTTEETNSDRFEIQRSADAKQWTKIGTELSAGESKGQHMYQFSDIAPLAGTNYYRLKMVDKDGTYAFSRIRKVEPGNSGLKIAVYPNPVIDKLYIQDKDGNELSGDKFENVSIFNIQGAEVYKSTGTSTTEGIDLKGVVMGMYVLKIKLIDGSQSTHKLLVGR